MYTEGGKISGDGTDASLVCAYCCHFLGDSNPVTYINKQAVCAMCLSRMQCPHCMGKDQEMNIILDGEGEE